MLRRIPFVIFVENLKIMQVVSAREFRANQTKVLSAARSGQTIMLTSRVGVFKIVPITSEDEIVKRDIRESLEEVRNHMAGHIDLPNARDIDGATRSIATRSKQPTAEVIASRSDATRSNK